MVAGVLYQFQKILLLRGFQEKAEETGATDIFRGGEIPIDRQVIGVAMVFLGQASARMLQAARSQVSLSPGLVIFLPARFSDD